jgi:hypothetical protein
LSETFLCIKRFKDVLNSSGPSSNRIRALFKRVKHFFQLPYTHFLFNMVFYGIFLMIFSYLMLYDYHYTKEVEIFVHADRHDNLSDLLEVNESNSTQIEIELSTKLVPRVSPLEFLVIFWIICVLFEECRQVGILNVNFCLFF